MDRKQIGRIGLAMAIAYFTKQEYTISLPMNDTQWYDLIIEKNGVFETVQCKATQTQEGKIDFRSTGGTNGSVYDHLMNHNVTYLFCVDKDFNCFNIPLQDIINYGKPNGISLRTTPTVNKQGFQTYSYLIK